MPGKKKTKVLKLYSFSSTNISIIKTLASLSVLFTAYFLLTLPRLMGVTLGTLPQKKRAKKIFFCIHENFICHKQETKQAKSMFDTCTMETT